MATSIKKDIHLSNRDAFYCPKCMYVLDEYEAFQKEEDQLVCHGSDTMHTFSLDDYTNIKRCRFDQGNLQKIKKHIAYYLDRGASIRVISNILHLKKSFVSQFCIQQENKKSHVKHFTNEKIFISKYDRLLIRNSVSIRKMILEDQIKVLYSYKACSPEVISKILSEINRLGKKPHTIRRIIQKLQLKKTQYIYQLDKSQNKIFVRSDWVLNYLMTYKIRAKKRLWAIDFFKNSKKMLEYLGSFGIYLTSSQLKNVYESYQLDSELLDSLSTHVYEIHDNFVYKFDNGYKLFVEFDQSENKMLDLNRYHGQKKV